MPLTHTPDWLRRLWRLSGHACRVTPIISVTYKAALLGKIVAVPPLQPCWGYAVLPEPHHSMPALHQGPQMAASHSGTQIEECITPAELASLVHAVGHHMQCNGAWTSYNHCRLPQPDITGTLLATLNPAPCTLCNGWRCQSLNGKPCPLAGRCQDQRHSRRPHASQAARHGASAIWHACTRVRMYMSAPHSAIPLTQDRQSPSQPDP